MDVEAKLNTLAANTITQQQETNNKSKELQ